MSYIPEPITRIDKYLAYIAGNMDVALPDHPITRKEHYLAAWAEKSGFEDVDVAGEPPLTLENGIGKPLKGLKIYGRSKQITTTGAQLLDYDKIANDSPSVYSVDGNSLVLLTTDGRIWDRVPEYGNLPAGTYYASPSRIEIKRASDNSSIFDGEGTFKISEDTVVKIKINIPKGQTVKYPIVVNPMLNAGATPLPWEPYTGGQPSPSPDYPQEIESVGMRWSTGANLLDISQWNTYEKTYGLTCTIENDTVIIKGVYERPNYEIGTRIQAMYRFLRYKTGTTFPDGAKVVAQIIKGDGAEGIYVSSGLKENTPCIVIAFYAVTGQEVEIQLKPMIYVGDTVPEWEPYTGGVPKPYGDKIGVNVRGKNLLRIDNSLEKYESEEYAGTANRIISSGMVAIGLDNANLFVPQYISNCVMDNGSISYHTKSPGFSVGIGAQLISGRTYICTFESTNNGRLCLLYYDANGICLKKQDFVKSTFTVPENVVYTVLLFRDADKAGDYKFWNIQLELGDTATSYEPYHTPQSMGISTPNGLPGIPVASGGNYTDPDGQQWICDEIDFARGMYVQRVWKGEFDGSDDERWEIYNNANYAGFYLNNVFAERLAMRNGIANTYKVDNSFIPIEAVWIGMGERAIYIKNSRFYDDTLSDKGLSNFKAGLAAYPMVVMTYLDNPIETPLTADQLNAYKALRTYKGTTIIDNDAGAYMSVKYEKMK